VSSLKTALHGSHRLLGLILVLSAGVGSGILAGAANASQPAQRPRPAQASAASRFGLDAADSFMTETLLVEETAPPTPLSQPSPTLQLAPKPGVRSLVKTSARRAAPIAVPAVNMPKAAALAAGAGASCTKGLDDDKINWLLDLSAKARADHPELAGSAAKVDQQLRSVMGKNLCPAEAQAYVASMCQDPGEVKFFGEMVHKLPFFIRPLVGDPCKADLVAAANKWMP
jgi:hypothetical protein